MLFNNAGANVPGEYADKIDTEKVETRISKEGNIVEYKLEEEGVTILSGEGAKVSVKDFLKGCKARVDVILDPQPGARSWRLRARPNVARPAPLQRLNFPA